MDITHIFELAILLVSAIVSVFVIPLLKQKLERDKLDKVLTYVEIAVTAADQLFSTEQGAEKKAYVVAYLNEELAKRGLTVDVETLENMIEAQVLLLHNELKND